MKGRLTYGHLPSWKRHGLHYCEGCEELKRKLPGSKLVKGWRCSDCRGAPSNECDTLEIPSFLRRGSD